MKNIFITTALIASVSMADSTDTDNEAFSEYPKGCKTQYESYLDTNNFDDLFSCYSALKADDKKIIMVAYSK